MLIYLLSYLFFSFIIIRTPACPPPALLLGGGGGAAGGALAQVKCVFPSFFLSFFVFL
jgi:hypothetical protein